MDACERDASGRQYHTGVAYLPIDHAYSTYAAENCHHIVQRLRTSPAAILGNILPSLMHRCLHRTR